MYTNAQVFELACVLVTRGGSVTSHLVPYRICVSDKSR